MTVKYYSLADGKYTLVRDDFTYQIRAYRHDEQWPAMTEDLIGNKLVNALLDFIDDLQEELEGDPK